MMMPFYWLNKWWILLVLSFVALAFLFWAWISQTRKTMLALAPPAPKPWELLEVSYTNHAYAVPLFVAAEGGLFAHQGLQVNLKDIGFPVHVRIGGSLAPTELGLQAVWDEAPPGIINFEELDILASSGFELAQRHASASRLVFVHPLGITPTGDMITALLVRSGAGIKDWSDFKGKKIGIYEPGDAGVLQRVFHAHGMSALTGEDDDILPMKVWRNWSHFDSGQLDALYTWGSIARRLMDERPNAYRVFARNLDCEPEGKPWYEACTYINKEVLSKRPEVVRRYVAAIDAAIDFIRAFPNQSRAIVAKYEKLSAGVAERMEIYHFLKSTEPLDLDDLNRNWEMRTNKAGKIKPELYYPNLEESSHTEL